MSHPAKGYDVMRDIVVRSGIRDRMIDDLRRSMEEIANWTKYAKAHEFSRGAKGAEEHAAKALKRFREAWAKL